MVSLKKLSRDQLQTMANAGMQVLECYRVLQKSYSNVVAEVLRGQGEFYELDHYPMGTNCFGGNCKWWYQITLTSCMRRINNYR